MTTTTSESAREAAIVSSEPQQGTSSIVDDELIRARVRAFQARAETRKSPFEKIMTNPLASIVLAFVLTGVVGQWLTNNYTTKQKEIDAERARRQQEADRLFQSKQKELEFFRALLQRQTDSLRDQQNKIAEAQHNHELRELDRERDFAIELNKTRVTKIGAVWEKLFLYEAAEERTENAAKNHLSKILETSYPEVDILHPRLTKADHLILNDLEKVYKTERNESDQLFLEIRTLVEANRFWLGEKMYQRIKEYFTICRESASAVANETKDAPHLAQRKQQLRAQLTSIRDAVMHE
jgi:hypothetical protein